VEIPTDFDAELEKLLSGADSGSAPREDDKGGLRPDAEGDSPRDGEDSGDGDSEAGSSGEDEEPGSPDGR
ncbi:MAG: zinc-dependent metalloprotease, partial [Brachybacterium tyrofermentans]